MQKRYSHVIVVGVDGAGAEDFKGAPYLRACINKFLQDPSFTERGILL